MLIPGKEKRLSDVQKSLIRLKVGCRVQGKAKVAGLERVDSIENLHLRGKGEWKVGLLRRRITRRVSGKAAQDRKVAKETKDTKRIRIEQITDSNPNQTIISKIRGQVKTKEVIKEAEEAGEAVVAEEGKAGDDIDYC